MVSPCGTSLTWDIRTQKLTDVYVKNIDELKMNMIYAHSSVSTTYIVSAPLIITGIMIAGGFYISSSNLHVLT